MGCFSRFLRPKRSSEPPTNSPKPFPALQKLSTATRRKVALPPELVLRVFELASLDSPAPAASFALLCASARDRARQTLYTAPVLRTPRQVNLFIRTVRKNPHLARLVRKLVLVGRETGAGDPLTSRLAKITEACGSLVELDVRRCIIFALCDFANAFHLKHVTLTSCVLSDRTTTSRYQPFLAPLPALESLSLRQVRFDLSTADHFLCARILPRVVALELDSCRVIEDPSSLNDLGPYEPVGLAEQLELLHIFGEPQQAPGVAARRAQPDVDPFDLVGKCAALRSLALPVTAVSAELLESLPTEHLTHLNLLPPRKEEGESDLFEPHLAAALALSTSFLALAATAPSSFSPSHLGSRSPLSRSLGTSWTPSPSTPNSPLALSPFTSPGPSPSADAEPSPLSQLLELTLPASWDVLGYPAGVAGEGPFKAHGEFAWAMGRIVRECSRREVEVRFSDGKQEKRRLSGREMVEGVERVRRAVRA
ncbi:hypothetical protein JCM8097_009348 [Rhodosporidiobolus ruineniae]